MFYKRNDFVYRTPNDYNNIKYLFIYQKKWGYLKKKLKKMKLPKCCINEIISFMQHLIKNNDTEWLKIMSEKLRTDVENIMITNPIEAEATEDE